MKFPASLTLLFLLFACKPLEKQTAAIFEPAKLDAGYRFTLPENTREIFIPVSRRDSLNGLLYEEKGNSYLMIYFQGNAKNLQNFLDNHSMALGWGYNVLVTDYRSFGKSTGKLKGQKQLYADAEKVYAYAIKLGYKPENIILYGYSMGTASAAYLAATQPAKALILESGYSSIPEISWVGNKAPRYELNTAEKAKTITIPTLLIHGSLDEVITPDHAQRVYANLKTPEKKLVIIEGGKHGDLRKRPEYQKIVNDFIDQH